MPEVLQHLPFNAGQPARIPRGAVPAEAVEALLPVLEAEVGPVPGFEGWFIDVRRRRGSPDASGGAGGSQQDGAAYFQLAEEPGQSRRPALMAFTCWQEAPAAEMWEQALSAYHALHPALQDAGLWRPPPRRPPAALPWLVTWLTPFAQGAGDPALAALTQLARCTAWALGDR